MIWVRKFFAGVLSSLLVLILVVVAWSTSLNSAIAHPQKIETWLSQSNLYGNFVKNAIQQAQDKQDDQSDSDSISLSDSLVQQAAETAFSPALLEKDVNTFLDSNYDWLSGKTDKPEFRIDLSQAKQDFATQIGTLATNRLNNLPVCTPAELAGITEIDALSISCRPSNLDPIAEGAKLRDKLLNSGDFLSNPVITADTITPEDSGSKNNATKKAYYQELSYLPHAYQLGVKMPWILSGIAALLALAIIFLLPSRRRGLRRIGSSLLTAGILILIVSFVMNGLFHKVEHKVFNESKTGLLQQALTTFAGKVEHHIATTGQYFGIAFAVLGLAIIISLLIVRPKGPKAEKPEAVTEDTTAEAEPIANPAPRGPAAATKPTAPMMDMANRPRRGSTMDIGSSPRTTKANTAPKPATPTPAQPQKRPVSPRRPRIIQ